MLLFTFTMLFNGGMIPTYILIKNLGMLDTIWAPVSYTHLVQTHGACPGKLRP